MDDGKMSDKHVVWPGILRVEREEGVVSLYNAAHGTSLDVEEESRELVESVLAGFEGARTLDDFRGERPEVPEALLTLLVRSGFVVAEAELPFLEHGFLRPTATPVGQLWSWSDLPELAQPDGWVVVGVPVDLGALGRAGARDGPSEIRKQVSGPLLCGEGDVVDHEFGRLYPALSPLVADLGDIDPEGARLDHVGSRLAKVVRELCEHDMRPLVLGGDHSITHYVLDALLARVPRFGLIHFDAHHDMTPSRSLSHANLFTAALESPQVEHVLQIGLRVIERMPPYAVRRACPKRRVVTARQAARGAAMAALESLPRDLPYYLSFDIDCLDASVVRETGTPVFGGMSFELASELVDYIARTFALVGADFVEVASAQGPVNAGATIAASLLSRCVIGKSPFEPLSSDIYALHDARSQG